MNTHDIELPAEFRSSNGVSVERATITRARMEEILVNAIEADRQRRMPSVPDGWKLVPIEPTEEMVQATYTDAASPQTRKHDAGFRAGIIRKAVAAARAQQGGQPAANHAPCDAGEICIDCQPRRPDGSCPDGPAASPAGSPADSIGFCSFDPDDRFYHAADRTWWRRDNDGMLVRAEAPAASAEPITPKKISRSTMVELKKAVYQHHGWTRAAGESMSVRIGALYEVTADHRSNRFIATPKAAQAQPSGDVDGLTAASVEPVAYQVRRTDGSPLACWETCTKEFYDDTLRTGRYGGFDSGPTAEVRTLYAAPVAQEPVGTLECSLSDVTFWPDDSAVWKLAIGEHPLYAAPVAAQARPTMPALTDAMRAVLRNEHDVYGDEDALYAALCDAAGAQPVVNQQMTTAARDVLADTQRAIIEAAERRGYERAIAECAQDREDALTPAARDVLAERRRQIEAEGWAQEHDDSHHTGEMALAAGCYAMYAHHPDYYGTGPRENRVPRMWPWAEKWWKQASPRRMLVKAGALILAEIERIDRAADRAAKEGS